MTVGSVHDRSHFDAPGGDRLFERARNAADIEAIAGVQLYRSGRTLRGQCPLCGAGKGKRGGGPFACHPKEKWFRCWACGGHGDAIELEHLMYGLPNETPADAARRILGEDKPRPERKVRAAKPIPVFVPEDTVPGWTADFAARIWKEALPAEGTLVERYLRWRGFSGWVLETALKQLRFHPTVYHSGSGSEAVAHPAMVLPIRAPAGATGGIHVTYLKVDGQGKAEIAGGSSKIMWGPQSRDGKPGGGWLSHPRDPGPLIVAEGLESVLSLATLHGKPCRMLATLALDRLQGGWLRHRGCVSIEAPRPDPDRPPLTWPEPVAPLLAADGLMRAPAAPWGEVIIGVDNDMKPIRVKVQGAFDNRRSHQVVEHMLSAAERARVCGTLAAAGWRATTDAPVRVMMPPPGHDFNDVLIALKQQSGRAENERLHE